MSREISRKGSAATDVVPQVRHVTSECSSPPNTPSTSLRSRGSACAPAHAAPAAPSLPQPAGGAASAVLLPWSAGTSGLRGGGVGLLQASPSARPFPGCTCMSASESAARASSGGDGLGAVISGVPHRLPASGGGGRGAALPHATAGPPTAMPSSCRPDSSDR
eukprot:351732-Chlamydomonas_euryale.AAC.5